MKNAPGLSRGVFLVREAVGDLASRLRSRLTHQRASLPDEVIEHDLGAADANLDGGAAAYAQSAGGERVHGVLGAVDRPELGAERAGLAVDDDLYPTGIRVDEGLAVVDAQLVERAAEFKGERASDGQHQAGAVDRELIFVTSAHEAEEDPAAADVRAVGVARTHEPGVLKPLKILGWNDAVFPGASAAEGADGASGA